MQHMYANVFLVLETSSFLYSLEVLLLFMSLIYSKRVPLSRNYNFRKSQTGPNLVNRVVDRCSLLRFWSEFLSQFKLYAVTHYRCVLNQESLFYNFVRFDDFSHANIFIRPIGILYWPAAALDRMIVNLHPTQIYRLIRINELSSTSVMIF